MNKSNLFFLAFVLCAINLCALDIKTTDGEIYKNVSVTNVLPDAVGFMYTKPDGTPVIRDVKMTLLTKDLQKKFNYSPKKAEAFKKQVEKFRKDREILQEKHRAEDLALFRKHKEFAQELNHIKAMLYAHRIECWVHIIRPVGQDCIGKVSTDPSTTKYGNLGSFYIRNLTGAQNALIKTTIYPTDQTKSFQDGIFPVYDADLTKYALELTEEKKVPPTEGLPGVKTGKKLEFPGNPQKSK